MKTKSLTPDQQATVLEYLPMARKTAAAYRSPVATYEETVSVAQAALCHAIITYDPSRNVPIGAHAYRRIISALQDAYRSTRPAGYRRLRLYPLTHSLDPSYPLSAYSPDAAVEIDDFFDTLFSTLAPRVARIMRLYYLRCDCQGNLSRVARALHLSRSYVGVLFERGLEELRLYYESQGAVP